MSGWTCSLSAHALAAAHAVELRVREQREVREQQQERSAHDVDASRPSGTATSDAAITLRQHEHAFEHEIIHDLDAARQVRRDLVRRAAREKALHVDVLVRAAATRMSSIAPQTACTAPE